MLYLFIFSEITVSFLKRGQLRSPIVGIRPGHLGFDL